MDLMWFLQSSNFYTKQLTMRSAHISTHICDDQNVNNAILFKHFRIIFSCKILQRLSIVYSIFTIFCLLYCCCSMQFLNCIFRYNKNFGQSQLNYGLTEILLFRNESGSLQLVQTNINFHFPGFAWLEERSSLLQEDWLV